MDSHISTHEIEHLFSLAATEAEVGAYAGHIARCPLCWERAAGVIAALKTSKKLIVPRRGKGRPSEDRFNDAREALVTIMELEESRSIGELRAKSWWTEIRDLSPREQARKLDDVAALQKRDVFSLIVQEAKHLCSRDPFAAENLALSAYNLVGHLPTAEFPEAAKDQLKLSALTVVANSRRLAGDWAHSFAAISEARSYLKATKINPEERAFLVAMHACLVCDTGGLEEAMLLLEQAESIYREAGNLKGLASVRIYIASALLEAARGEESLRMAEDVLHFLAPDWIHLEMLTRSIVTESLVLQGRNIEALRSYESTKHLYAEIGGETVQYKAEYLEARILDGFGYAREAEKLFRSAIRGLTESESYRPSLLARLALFESFCKRGALGKAAQLCGEAINLLKITESIHFQIRQVWEGLLMAVNAETITLEKIQQIRDYMVRHWTSPAARTPVLSAER
jgi:tetratricopeptide (TPR) repeat protein